MAFTRQALVEAGEAGFRHLTVVPFQHVDAAGIVFFARVLDYLHDAYVGFLASAGHPLHEVLRDKRWAAPLTHAEADFLAPLRFGDAIEVGLVAAEVEGSKVTIGYRIRAGDSARVLAVGQTVHVFVDPRTFQRVEIPPDLAEAFRGL